MTAAVTAAAFVGVAGTAVIYGTNVFSALMFCPAASDATDASVADLIGRIHHHGDRRLPAPGIAAVVAAAIATVFARATATRAAAAQLCPHC